MLASVTGMSACTTPNEASASTALLWQLDFQAQELALIDKDLGQAVIFAAALGNFAP